MKTKFILTILAAAPALALAESDYEAVIDDSVVGYWRFNDPNDYGKDASGHGSHITEFRTSTTAVGVADLARDGGYLQLKKDGSSYGTAIATANGPRTVDLSSSTKGWTIATWIRGTENIFNLNFIQKLAISANPDAEAFYSAMTDGKWHPIVVVFRPSKSTECYRIYVNPFDSETVTDVCSTQDTPGNYNWKFPVSISGTSITLGGKLAGAGAGLGSMSADFFGDLDDCLIIDRELAGGGQPTDAEKAAGTVRTNDEVFRWVQTGETFVYSKGSSGNMFYETGSWSNNKVPQAGLAYMIENGCEVKSSKTATFAGRSLSVGRTEKLYGIKSVGGAREVIIDNTVGKLLQTKANTTMTVDDLVLNDGMLTSSASGQQLVANIRVRAAASNPFKISVSNGTYAVSGTMTGAGSISKIGQGTLDLSGLTESTAKVSLSEGALRLSAVNPTLSGYTGGTLLVDFDEDAGSAETVALDSAWTGALSFMLNGTPSGFARYAVLTVPTSVKQVTTADFDNKTVSANGMTVRTKIVTNGSVQTVYVESIPSADAAGSPVLGFE